MIEINKQKEIEENKKLLKKYPWLLPRSVWTGQVSKDYDYSYILIKDDIPIGWWKAFGELLCEDIQKELEKFNYVDKFRIVQAKEKYGALRIYTDPIPKECKVWDIIENYATLSKNICIICGKLDVPMVGTHWFEPICKNCVKKWGAKDSEAEYERCHKKQFPHKLSWCRKYQTPSKITNGWVTHVVDIRDIVKKVRTHYEGNDKE